MIQRIQTVYLLITAILVGTLCIVPLAHGIASDAISYPVSIWGFVNRTPSPDSYSGSWLNLAAGFVSIITAILAIVTIFLYKKRILQKKLCHILLVLLILLCVTLVVYLVQTSALFEGFKLSVICAFPIIAFIMIILARKGIIHDEKLVRSLDRIR